MTTSQNGYAASGDRAAIDVHTFAVPGRGDVLLPVRADVAPLFLEMARWWNTWEPLLNPGCWGYSYRPIKGATQLSNHASGTAVDLNAPQHPLGATGTLGDRRDAVIAKAASLGLRSGAAYSARKDEMHLELVVPLDEALKLVTRLQGGKVVAGAVPTAVPTGAPRPGGRPTVRQGGSGPAVRQLQGTLNRFYPKLPPLAEDGVFGARTAARVEYFQGRAGLPANGVVDAAVWAALGFR